MTERDLAERLLRLARDDRQAARTLLDGDAPESTIGFHCQQAVEKALKAVLAVEGWEFPYTHNLGLLIQLCGDADASLPAQLADVDRLTPFAAQMRYGTTQAPDVDLVSAVEWAGATIDWADARLRAVPPLSE